MLAKNSHESLFKTGSKPDPQDNKYKIKVHGLEANSICEYIEECAQMPEKVNDYSTIDKVESKKSRLNTSVDLKNFMVREQSLLNQ